MDLKIAGLRVLVTAGASGIGLATARAFAREGARVFICDVDRSALKAVGASDAALEQTECDVAAPSEVSRLFDRVTAEFGGLDALVNNAGIAGPTAACEDIALADWERTLAVNLTGQFLCAQRAIPLLKASGNASIANLSSAAGRFGFPLRTPYAATKWGVIGFTKSLSIELGRFGIRVNAICPGSVAGARIDARIGEQGSGARYFARGRARGSAVQGFTASPGQRGRHRERDRLPCLAGRSQHLRSRAAGRRRHAVAQLDVRHVTCLSVENLALLFSGGFSSLPNAMRSALGAHPFAPRASFLRGRRRTTPAAQRRSATLHGRNPNPSKRRLPAR